MKKIALLTIICFTAGITYAQGFKTRINHTAVFVVDLKKSTAFYTEMLGLDTIPEPFHDGKHTWLRIGPGAAMHIIEGAPERKQYYKNQHTCFSVESVTAFTEKLKKAGIAFEDVSGKQGAITTRIDGVHQIWLQDPDGYWLEINDARD